MLRNLLPLLILLPLSAACAAPAPAPAPAPASPGAPAKPKVERLVMAVEPPKTENNELRMLNSDNWQLDPAFEYLIGLDPQTGKLAPGLATEWSLDLDAMTYRFKVRPGVKFHKDFGEVTAKDLVASFKELIKEDSLQGSSPFFRQTVKQFEAVNEMEVTYKLTTPTGEFLPSMSQERAGAEIMSAAHLAKNGPATMDSGPIAGTAPYQFAGRSQGAYVRFERAPYQHWRTTPDFSQLEFRFLKEPSTRMAALLTGEAQMAALPSDLQAQATTRPDFTAIGARTPVTRVRVQFDGVYYKDLKELDKGGYVHPNSPLMDVRVRRALSKAINRDEMNKAFFGGKGKPIYNYSFNPNWPGWNADWERRFAAEYGYDLAAAQALLAEAGFGPNNPLKTTMLSMVVQGLAAGPDVAEAIAGYWSKAGIRVDLVTMETASFSPLQRDMKLDNHALIHATSANIWTGTSTHSSGIKATRSGGVGIPAGDRAVTLATSTLDEKKQDEAFRAAGNAWFDGHVDAPLFYLPPEITVNKTIVADYIFPGNVTGNWSHVETIKAAK